MGDPLVGLKARIDWKAFRSGLNRVPDSKTVWLFRKRLKHLDRVQVLFDRFHPQLAEQGYAACTEQRTSAGFVEVPGNATAAKTTPIRRTSGCSATGWPMPQSTTARSSACYGINTPVPIVTSARSTPAAPIGRRRSKRGWRPDSQPGLWKQAASMDRNQASLDPFHIENRP